MKIVLIVIGSLAGLYAAVGAVLFIVALATPQGISAYAVSNVVLHLVPVCLGLIVCLACFQGAFRNLKPPKL